MIKRRPTPSEIHRLLREELRAEQASVRRLTEELRRREAEVRDAEHRVRHQVADTLHDEVLQDLLAAGQDVAEAVDRLGDDATLTRAAEGIDRSAAQLRGLLGAMQAAPPASDGLSAALADVADRLSRQGGMAVDWSVAPDAEGPHDALVLSLGARAAGQRRQARARATRDRHRVAARRHRGGAGDRRRSRLSGRPARGGGARGPHRPDLGVREGARRRRDGRGRRARPGTAPPALVRLPLP